LDLQKQRLAIDLENNQIVKRTADPGLDVLGVKAMGDLMKAVALAKNSSLMAMLG